MELTPEARALKGACEAVVRVMKEEGTWGDAHRVPEYVDSLLEHAKAKFPDVLRDGEKLASMRQDMIDVVMQASVFAERGDN